MNIAIITEKYFQIYGNTIETTQSQIILVLLLILLIRMIVTRLVKKKTDQTGNDMKIDVEIMVPLKYLSNFREP